MADGTQAFSSQRYWLFCVVASGTVPETSFLALFLWIGLGDEPVPVPTPPPTEVVPSGVVAVPVLPPFDPPLEPPPPAEPPPAANAPDDNAIANADKATAFEIRFITILLIM
jgi:hypothetical protein